MDGTLGYIDKTLVHYTPDHPEGIPYSPEQLDKLHDDFIASRTNMFCDVVYNQFGHLNIPPVIAEVAPVLETVYVNTEYIRQLDLLQGDYLPNWSVVEGPAGLQVMSNGFLHGWIPTSQQLGQTFTVTVKAENLVGYDQQSWQIEVVSP